jgi:glutamine cyclotransferase
MQMKTMNVYATTMVTLNLRDVLNQIENECVPENVHLTDDTLVHIDPETGHISKNLRYSEDREKQLKEILTGLNAIRHYYGIQ